MGLYMGLHMGLYTGLDKAHLYRVPPRHHAHGRHDRRRQAGDVRVVVVAGGGVAGVRGPARGEGGHQAVLRGAVGGPVPGPVEAQEGG